MKITIETDTNIQETEFKIRCNSITPNIEKIISTLNVFEKRLTVKKDNEIFFINISEVIYIDTVDKKTFVYTRDNVYETTLKLYELEEQFEFFRASKSCIINIKFIKSLKSDFDRKIRVTMDNNEKIIVSRQYAIELKELLGVK